MVKYSVDDGTESTKPANIRVAISNVQDPPVTGDTLASGKKNVPILVNLPGADPIWKANSLLRLPRFQPMANSTKPTMGSILAP